MSDWRDAVENAREQARKAKEEARRLREEARALERRLKEEARQDRREDRRSRRDRNRTRERVRGVRDATSGPASEETFSTKGLKSVRIHQTAGTVTVEPCKEGETPGVRTSGQRSAPNLEVSRGEDSLSIDVRLSAGWLFRRRQGARTTVKLGPEVLDQLDVDAGHGTLRVENIKTIAMKLHVGAGDVSATDCTGSLDAEVGAGRITVTGHDGLVRSNTGTGDATVDVAVAHEGRYSLDVGMGRVELRLPAGEEAFLELSSGIGRKRVDYPNAGPDAPIQVRLNTGIGEAVVRERPATGTKVRKARPDPRQATPQTPRREADELRILQMLEQGKLSSQEAAELIAALHGAPPPDLDDTESDDEFLDLSDDDDDGEESHPTDELPAEKEADVAQDGETKGDDKTAGDGQTKE